MRLDLNSLLYLYPFLKILHYQTREGFHHEKYDEAFDRLGEIVDQFIETYMGIHGRSWSTGIIRPIVDRTMPDSTVACIDRYEQFIIRRVSPYLYEVGKESPALTKLAEDFEQEALKVLALLKGYNNK